MNLTKKIAKFEITILIASIIAFAFIVGCSTGEIKIVSAQETESERNTNNNIQGAGCCFDEEEGLCSPNILEKDCEKDKGKWLENYLCETKECKMGCCLLGTESLVSTERRCNKLSELNGIPAKWDASINEEVACFNKATEQEVGACVIIIEDEDKNNCKLTNKEECIKITGSVKNFHKDVLCSNPVLETKCEKQANTGCVDGRDEIYWFDSCENRENIYDANKERSWNNGRILSKQQSCNPNSENSASSTCGNCNYELGSICAKFRAGKDKKINDGEYTCRNLNCKRAPANGGVKKDRINGESWCVYDGQIGNIGIGPIGVGSADTVGSRHWRYMCVNGEVKVEPCADHRKEICVQDTKKVGLFKTVDNAFCRTNMWEQCINANSGGAGNMIMSMMGGAGGGCGPDCMTKCNANPDCHNQPVFVDEQFWFDTCAPNYAPGIDLGSASGLPGIASSSGERQLEGVGGTAGSSATGGTAGSDVCGLASKTCTVTFVKHCPGGWECDKNCMCMTLPFTLEMGALCSTLGDCGVKANYAGRVTFLGAVIFKTGSKGVWPPPVQSLALLMIVFAKAIPGQHAKPGAYDSIEKVLELPTLGIGNLFGNMFGATGAGEVKPEWGEGLMGGSVQSQAIAGAGGAAIGALFGPWGAAIGAIIGAVLTALFGCGKVKQEQIIFQCLPWQRPLIGDCSKCNEDKYKACSRYRCEALGMNCGIINEGTQYGKCISIKQELKVPTITPDEKVLDKSLYKYSDISTNGFRIRTKEGGCIQAFTPLLFGIKTDVYAVCTLSTGKNFSESSGNYFFENIGGVFTKNHTYATYLPSAEILIAGEVNSEEELDRILNTRINEDDLTEENKEELEDAGMNGKEIQALTGKTVGEYLLNKVGDINLYVTCTGADGRSNEQEYRINFCVKPGPDLTPPVIVAVSPPEDSNLKFDATEQKMALFASEPSECKWDVVRSTSASSEDAFKELKNTMECKKDVELGTLIGYPCNTTLPITADENKFYFMCKDQPWLGESDNRNIGSIYQYVLKKSKFALEIILIEPTGKLMRGAEPASIDIEAETSGGVNNGDAVCEYKLNELQFTKFLETGTNYHIQPSLMLTKGDYELEIKCIDKAGNSAAKKTSFTLELDTTIPEVTRVYNEAGNLVVLTNEDATCYFTNDKSIGCNFMFETENITLMSGTETEHTTIWNQAETHYIRCKDIWGNSQADCSIVIKPYNQEYSTK